MIPMDYVTDVCKIGQGADCCAYLIAGGGGLECAKDLPGGRDMIEGRLLGMTAQGDNCIGWRQVSDVLEA